MFVSKMQDNATQLSTMKMFTSLLANCFFFMVYQPFAGYLK